MILSNETHDACAKLLLADEEFREFPYLDTKGIWTFGIGRTRISFDEAVNLVKNDLMSIDTNNISAEIKKVMRETGYNEFPCEGKSGEIIFGFGRTFIYLNEAVQLLDNDIVNANRYLSFTNFYNNLNDVRKIVLISMYFNLGPSKLLKFVRFLAALNKSDFNTAANEMLDSKWATEIHDRANRLAKMMRTGALSQ